MMTDMIPFKCTVLIVRLDVRRKRSTLIGRLGRDIIMTDQYTVILYACLEKAILVNNSDGLSE